MQKEQLYRAYSAEMLRGIATTLGVQVAHTYMHLLSNFDSKPGVDENKTADEVIGDIRDKLSRFGGEENGFIESGGEDNA